MSLFINKKKHEFSFIIIGSTHFSLGVNYPISIAC